MHLGGVLAGLGAGRPAEGFAFEVPDEWRQGRTLYGGLNAALCVQAAQRAFGPAGELRTVEIAFVAPVAGRVRYEPVVLRRGRSVTFVGVDCLGDAGLASRAILAFGAGRENAVRSAAEPAVPVPAPDDCPPLPVADGLPTFLAQMEVRFAAGSMPFSAGEPAFAMWVRHRDASGVAPATALVAVADTLPPAALAQVDLSEPHPASSITWTIDLAPPAPDPEGWYLLETRSEQTADGYSLQLMRGFAPDGRLVAAGRQTVAIF